MVDSARRAELAEQRRVEAEAAAARAATKPFGLPFQDKPPPASGPQLSTPEKKSLAAAFGNVGEKPGAKLSTKGQAQIRNHLHSSLEKYSLSNRDPRTGVGAKIQMKERLGARGAHWGDGRMAIQGEVARNAGKFARDQAAGVDYAKAIKERSPESRDHAVRANDYRTHIHEQLHGYGPRGIMSNASYQGVGKMTEEAATEIAARKIVRDQIGITHDAMAGANYQWRALGRVEDEHQVGSYSKYINDTRESARTAIDELARIPMREVALRGVNWSDAYDHLETAALRFKSLDEHRDANDADGLTGLLGKSFDFDALARHAGRELTQADKDKFVETFVREMKQKAGSSRRW